MNSRLIIPFCATLAGLIFGAVSGTFWDSESPGDPERQRMPPASRAQRVLSMAGDTRAEAFNNALSIACSGTMDLRLLAQLNEALTLMDPERMPALLDRLESDTPENRRDRLTWFFRWWHQHDPSRATAWIQKRLKSAAQDGPLGDSFVGTSRQLLFEAWAKANPKDALQFARDCPRSGIAAYLLGYAIDAWPDQSGQARMALVMEFPVGNARERALKAVLTKWGEKEPSAAFAAAQALPEESERNKAVSAALGAWGKSDPEGAFAKYRDLGLSDIALATRLLASIAGKNPARAVELLAQIDPAQLAQVAPEIVSRWAERDPAAAFTWALETGVGLDVRVESTSEVVQNSFDRSMRTSTRYLDPLSAALQKQPKVVVDWINQLPPGADRDRMTERALESLSDLDLSLSLFASLPPEARERAVRDVAKLYSSKSELVPKAVQWAESLPEGAIRANAWRMFGHSTVNIPLPAAGPDRDAMLSGKVYGSGVFRSPIPPFETAMQISDPVLRRDMLDEMVEFFATAPPEWGQKALDWLEKSDVPEEWKQRWRTQVPAQ